MNTEKICKIRALGNLLQYYHSDLRYILQFQRFKKGLVSNEEYLSKCPGSLRSFINEYRIARNIRKAVCTDLLGLTFRWVHSKNADDVDKFAQILKEERITQENKTMTSLASKILFLNNPWFIIPCDRLNRRAVGVKTKDYSSFYSAAQIWHTSNKSLIRESLESVMVHVLSIEEEYKGQMHNLKKIRQNRCMDKLLWMHGLELET